MADGVGRVVPGPRAAQEAEGRRRRHQQAAALPLDVIADIAARSDPVTLVRCAATCSELRGRVAEPGFRRRLRLRHADRFVPSLLLGHLVGENKRDLCLLDATAADGTASLVRTSETFPPGPDGKPPTLHRPLSAREGLVLVRKARELRVCNLATGRSQTLPREPEPSGAYHHVLLVGDGEGTDVVGRPFQVLKARLVLEHKHRHLLVQTFSSELGAWGPRSEIRTPQIQGQIGYHHQRGLAASTENALRARPLVIGSAVHWLCLTDSGGYVLKIRVRAAAAPRLTVTKLPESYPNNYGGEHLLATMTVGGRPVVLVKGSAWTQSKQTGRWNQRPQVILKQEAFSRFFDNLGDRRLKVWGPGLVWFAERSGIVLLRIHDYYFVWLDLQSMEIVRWFKDDYKTRDKTIHCPCEMDLSTWVPTFSSTL